MKLRDILTRRITLGRVRNEERAENEPLITGADLLEIFGVNRDRTVTAEQALQIGAVELCVNMLSNAVGMLPVKLYRKNGEQIEEVDDDRRVTLLNDTTGDTLTATDMRTMWARDYLLKGRAYGYIDRRGGIPDSIYYVSPQNISASANADPIFKSYTLWCNGKAYHPDHFCEFLRHSDGTGSGHGIIDESGTLLLTAYLTTIFEKRLAKTGGAKKGFLTSKMRLSDESMAKMRAQWNDVMNTEEGSGVMILNDGMDYKDAAATAAETQLAERKAGLDSDVMNLFGTKDGVLSDETIKNALMPILNSFEAVFDDKLLTEAEKGTYYFAFDTRELTRGDINQRYDAYSKALNSNIMQLDEVRALEDLPPLGFNYIKLGLQDVLLNPKTGEVYTPNMNASANLNQLGNVGDVNSDTESRGWATINGHHVYFDKDGAGGGSASNSGKGVDKAEKSGIIANKDKIIADFKSTNFNGEVHIPPKSIDVDSLKYDSNHINNERNHAVSEKQAKQFIKDAKMSFSKTIKGETFENYIGYNGSTYVNLRTKSIRTAFGKDDFNKYTLNIIGTLKKYE